MNRPYDLVVRGGELVDGGGGPTRAADVAVLDGKIAAVGRVHGAGTEEIDARGMIVTPGFVDIHTHYDGQATWDARMQPSSWHGVTTVVMGNCGVGFAPCRPADHGRLIQLMEGVEDIPFPVLAEGLPWTWESYPQYLDMLEARRFDVDVASQLPHAALRVYAMGERGANREPATAADIALMSRLARSAVEAGALGFSTSRTLNHRTSDGAPTPTLTASEAELTGIAMGLSAAGAGVIQVVSDFQDPANEFAMLRRIVRRAGRPLSFTLAQGGRDPLGYRRLLTLLEAAVGEGLAMKAQVAARPVGILLGLELTLNPFSRTRLYGEIADLPLEARVARLKTRGFQEQLLSEAAESPAGPLTADWERVYLLDHGRPDYEPGPKDTVAFQARARNAAPLAVALAHMLKGDGRGMLYHPFLNYAQGSLDAVREMIVHKDTVPGLSDGGAHVGMICDGSFPTSMLTHWTRDRARGPRIPLAEVVRMQTRDTALAVGLADRGLVAVGYRADLNVIDHQGLTLGAPEVAHDLPAGGRRLIQRASGYVATVAGGEVTYRDGLPTGALPGRLVRGAKATPDVVAAA